MNAVGGVIRDQPAAGRAVAPRNIVVLNDSSVGVPEIDRVFLLLWVEIESRVRAGERKVVLQRDAGAATPKAPCPALKILASRSVRRVVSRVQKEVSRNSHVRGILDLDVRFAVGDHVSL